MTQHRVASKQSPRVRVKDTELGRKVFQSRPQAGKVHFSLEVACNIIWTQLYWIKGRNFDNNEKIVLPKHFISLPINSQIRTSAQRLVPSFPDIYSKQLVLLCLLRSMCELCSHRIFGSFEFFVKLANIYVSFTRKTINFITTVNFNNIPRVMTKIHHFVSTNLILPNIAFTKTRLR